MFRLAGVAADLRVDGGVREEVALFLGNGYFLGGDIEDRGVNTGIKDRLRDFTGVERGTEEVLPTSAH